MPNSVRISEEKHKAWGGGGGEVESETAAKKLKKKKTKTKKTQHSLPRGEKVPVGCCLGSALARRVNSAVVSSPLVSGRV